MFFSTIPTAPGKGTSDPYVVYSIGALSYTTSVVEKTCNPKYLDRKHKRSGEFLVYNENQKLFLDIYDRDFLSLDDHIATGSLTVAEMLGGTDVLDGEDEGDGWEDVGARWWGVFLDSWRVSMRAIVFFLF